MRFDLLALDGGQSGMRTLLRSGGVIHRGPEYSGVRSDHPLLPQLRDIVLSALQGEHVDVVALGVSGMGVRDTASELKALLGGAAGAVLLAHDGTTSYLGALGPREGAVVAAGTGAVTLAVGPSKVCRIDGWGHLLGDAGSGFWIGRAALTAVLRSHDRRGVPTSLTEVAVEEFGDLSQLYLQIQADPGRVARIASWARTVSEHAATDEVCARISREAGEQLALSAATGLGHVHAAPVVSTVGNVFRNTVLADAFTEELTRLVTDVDVVQAEGTGLDGAALLPRVTAGSALDTLIDRAE
ncbi:MAG: BadF/BadG/BcrA/BcrD ATPase family protein [Arachnia sp.]